MATWLMDVAQLERLDCRQCGGPALGYDLLFPKGAPVETAKPSALLLKCPSEHTWRVGIDELGGP